MSVYQRVSSEEGGSGAISPVDFRARHSCTDLPCCLVFIGSLVAFGALYVQAVEQGDTRKLYHGIDHHGHFCGVSPGLEDKPLLYLCLKMDLHAATKVANGKSLDLGDILGSPVCVKECPDSNGANVSACGDGSTLPQSYKSEALMERYCIPNDPSLLSVSGNMTSQYMDNFNTVTAESLSSIQRGWPVVLATFAVAVVLGYVHLTLLRCCAVCLLWVTIGATILVLAGGGGYLWKNAGHLLQHMPNDVHLPESATQHEEKVTQGVAIVLFALAAACSCVACCMHKSIDAAAASIEVACSAIWDMPSLLFAPVLKAMVKAVSFLVLVYGFLHLYSTGEVTGHGLVRVVTHTQTEQLKLFLYVLMSYWILCFINALYQFMVAYAVAEYYYEPHDEDGDKNGQGAGCCSAWEGIHVGLSFHAGSLAFGSFLLAFLHALQKAIEYAEMKNKEGGNNRVVSCILGICDCCIGCLAKILGFINRNAYIDMAIKSGNFCESAKNALAMIVELAGAMAVLNGATTVFAFFGSALITLASGAFAFLLCGWGVFAQEGSDYFVEEPIAVTVVSMCVAFLVSLAFMHVFDMASDTLLYCYGCDLHSGGGGHSAPPELKELVDNHGRRGEE